MPLYTLDDVISGDVPTEVFAGVLLVTIIFLILLRKALFGKAGIIRVSRSGVMMIGLCGSGKTALFSRLCSTRAKAMPTVTSMAANYGTLQGSSISVVDFPGHQRLRHKLYDVLRGAKKLIVVVDSVTVHDDKTEGARELSGLLFDVMKSSAFHGITEVLFACTKRDEPTSYSSKAIRRILETEMTRTITAKSGSIGAIRGEVKRNVRSGTSNDAASVHEECVLFLGENGKFSFSSLAMPVHFADCSIEQLDELKQFCEAA